MTRSEIALLLGAIAARDQRTVGDTDVLAWHEDLDDIDFDDARQAVRLHFRDSTDRIMPAHIRRLARIVREERAKSAITKTLPPGRFEDDPSRTERIAKGAAKVRQILAELAAKKALPADDVPTAPPTRSEAIHARALDRARAEKRNRRDAA